MRRVCFAVETSAVDRHQLAYSEYDTGNYARTFHVTEQIDVDRIDGVMKNGILRIVLPKSKEASPQTISIKGE